MMKRIFAIALFAGMLFSLAETARALAAEPPDSRDLIIFYSPSCSRCAKAKAEIMPGIEKKLKGRINIVYRDITDLENYKILLALRDQFDPKLEIELPVFFFENSFVNGKGDVAANLEQLISRSFIAGSRGGKLPRVDLISIFLGFEPLAVTAAGLIDGINPCAFTVIVFFISFLALQGYRKKELVIIGLSFIAAVFVTYLLIGLGIFNFFYYLKGFWLARKIINISIGAFSIGLGIFAAVDLLKFRKTGKTDGLFLQLPQLVKNRIHAVIGSHYRKDSQEKEGAGPRPMRGLLFSALVTGFLISILEAVCTGQVYLPTIAFVLKTSTLKLEALGYLLLYNLMFIIPLLIIFLFALLGVTSGEFSNFLKKRMVLIKFLMALLFFGLGAFLIWRA